ncbi:hypothetical protein BC938DRAFT_481609 [Jimgerdemannia flammicorona]|uniref:Uncharacterized protein n=1 Tax=Jimgerdemannia flammicorona TaxID=994334 RepID=A0A433QWS6_9FUNG|nr:hypothetical protein BC938DRAFT_481609 [Jimgerdemannia flammicorona]
MTIKRDVLLRLQIPWWLSILIDGDRCRAEIDRQPLHSSQPGCIYKAYVPDPDIPTQLHFTVQVFDNYYLGITALLTILYQLSFFTVAARHHFIVLAVLTLALGGLARTTVLTKSELIFSPSLGSSSTKCFGYLVDI